MDGKTNDLSGFELLDMVELGQALRRHGRAAVSVEDFAARLTDHLHDRLVSSTGEKQTVLVRCFLTLDAAGVQQLLGAPPVAVRPGRGTHTDRWLSLLASRGVLPAWNDRRLSQGHQALFLGMDAAAGSPMIAALFSQLGADLGAVQPGSEPVIQDPDNVHFGVFHVELAAGSPNIPAQDFVVDHGVRSAVGFGGVLPDGELFAVVMFTSVAVPATVATLFRTVSLSVRLALLELDGAPLCLGDTANNSSDGSTAVTAGPPPPIRRSKRLRNLRAERAMLEQLVLVQEKAVISESARAAEAVARWRSEAERSATLARTLQESLLPSSFPELPDLRFAGVFRPAGDGSEIGGDFYDVFTTRPQSGWFVVGDVSGKGASAAALTSVARHTLRALASSLLATPASALRRLNETLLTHDSDRHLTALVGHFRTGEDDAVDVTLALAGHPPALLLPSAGAVIEVGVPGTALGMFDTIDVTEVRVRLKPGDLLLAFTDGVTEARGSRRELYGDERLSQLLEQLRGRSPEELTSAVAAALLEFQHDWAADDIALLALAPIPVDRQL